MTKPRMRHRRTATAIGGDLLPVEGIGILFGVDTIPDMCRTAANVTGTMAAAVVLDPRRVRRQGKLMSGAPLDYWPMRRNRR